MPSETIITQTLPTVVGMGIVAHTTDKALDLGKKRRASSKSGSKVKARYQKRPTNPKRPAAKRKLIFGNMKTLL